MKNIFIYYLAFMIGPSILMYYLLSNENNVGFVIAILIYALIYRPIIDGLRLISKQVITKRQSWKLFIPFWHIKWMKDLYLS